MARTSVLLVMLAMFGAIGGLGYLHASRTSSDDSKESRPSAAAPTAIQPVRNTAETATVAAAAGDEADKPKEAPAQSSSASPTQQAVTGNVERWIADTQSNDAKTRAAAIAALANAPKAQAVPALERVLESGEPQVDRQIALRSLHTIALNDGDDNGAIRDAIRYAMYHSEDEGVTQSAQAVLEDIEAEFADRAQ